MSLDTKESFLKDFKIQFLTTTMSNCLFEAHLKLSCLHKPKLIQFESKRLIFKLPKLKKKNYAKASESAGKPNCHALLERMVEIW